MSGVLASARAVASLSYPLTERMVFSAGSTFLFARIKLARPPTVAFSVMTMNVTFAWSATESNGMAETAAAEGAALFTTAAWQTRQEVLTGRGTSRAPE